MMAAAAEAARETAEELGIARPRVVGVTVLTSLDAGDLQDVGQQGPLEAQVERLAQLAQASGLDGVVCSPREIARLRKACGPDFLLVVPGIRPAWAAAGRSEARREGKRVSVRVDLVGPRYIKQKKNTT